MFRNPKQPKLLVKTSAYMVLHSFTEEKLEIKNHFENTGPFIWGDGENKDISIGRKQLRQPKATCKPFSNCQSNLPPQGRESLGSGSPQLPINLPMGIKLSHFMFQQSISP